MQKTIQNHILINKIPSRVREEVCVRMGEGAEIKEIGDEGEERRRGQGKGVGIFVLVGQRNRLWGDRHST